MLRLQKVDFVYAKATQGAGRKDTAFPEFWNNLANVADKQKPFRGAYHFLSAHEDGKTQAERFVAYVNLHGGFKKDDMPPCVDLEWDCIGKTCDRDHDCWKDVSTEDILATLTAWLKRVKELTGRTPLVYTARRWWHDRGIPESKFATLDGYPIWVADYSRSNKATETPAVINNRKQDLWQFADNGQLVAGYKGKIDSSVFYGSEEEFEKAFGINR